MKQHLFFPIAVLFSLLTGCSAPDNLDRIPPEVRVNEPENDEVGAPISITVTATDNVSVTSVSLYVDEVFLEKKASPPYTFYWYSDYWGDGRSHRITATALDPSSNVGLSPAISVDVMKTTKPQVKLVSPQHHAIMGDSLITLKWLPIENTLSYTVQVSDTNSMDFLIIDAKTTSNEMTVNLPQEKTYVWRVLPATVGNIFGGWSKEYVFHRTQQFTAIFGRKKFDALSAIAATADGGLILAGSTHSLERGGMLIKTTPTGIKQWERIFGGYDMSWFTCVIQTMDGGYFAAGQNTSKEFPSDQWFVKTDSAGTIEWSKTILQEGAQGVNSVLQTKDSGYVVCGFRETDSDRVDIVLRKYDASFELIWERTIGGKFHDEAFQIAATADGGLIVSGFTQGSTDLSEEYAVALRLNFLGEEKWRREIAAPGGARFVSGMQHKGKYYFCGFVRNEDQQRDALVAAYDSIGNVLWTKTFGTNRDDAATGLTFVNDRIAVCGYRSTDTLGIQDAWLLLLGENGSEIASKTYGGRNLDGATSIINFHDGLAIVGSTTSFSAGSSDGFLILIDADGNVKHNAP
ncbi:MAG: Ig-like domain-containing protein [Bacteroidota bacterium]